MKKIKKVLASIIAFFISLPAKVLGTNLIIAPTETLYGVRNPNITIRSFLWGLAEIFSIPIVLGMGLFIYIKRKPESKLKKLLPVAIILLCSPLIVGFFYVVNLYLSTI